MRKPKNVSGSDFYSRVCTNEIRAWRTMNVVCEENLKSRQEICIVWSETRLEVEKNRPGAFKVSSLQNHSLASVTIW